ncbi:hypothetical protein FVO59_11905 [Microbacterium esteraromaticum]|uniref:Uncharacterized protein n=1 Tax=Microbacterium esteraromaticum TaxID=57043 RepID=A0A7D7WGU9_9MICO|nr:hypothetical protein [Microbacterium esteraromaticum]QMU97831.1 hypothetical protein FVO59_11905 [Microbacterium esteraromaticum]
MASLHEYLEDYAARHPGVREEWAERAAKFFAETDDVPDPIEPRDCTKPHPEPAGPNMDLGQCADCWMPIGVMRPDGESFGWHSADCSLPMRHSGYCQPGGVGHAIPDGWKIRG